MSWTLASFHCVIERSQCAAINTYEDAQSVMEEALEENRHINATSNRGHHVEGLKYIAEQQGHDFGPLAFLEEDYNYLNANEMVAAIHLLSKVCAGIINNSLDTSKIDQDMARKDVWEKGTFSDQDMHEIAYLDYLEAEPFTDLYLEDAGHLSVVQGYGYLKTLLKHLSATLMQGKVSLYFTIR